MAICYARITHPFMRYRCLLCGRQGFTRPGEPHRCIDGQYRKRFKKEAKKRGINAFEKYDSRGFK